MYAVTVHILIKPEFTAAFRELMLKNARASRASEPACRQFDVTVAPDDANHIFLYEIYDNEAAFDAHRATAHYRDFISGTAPWIVSKKAEFFQRIDPN
ncbi:MAG: antibiotic biosynthesis monooxygenase [Pseudomonadota bacterium]|nr:antibiotic biosynthesis monooxygenase [Pseudomonadota bacterium]